MIIMNMSATHTIKRKKILSPNGKLCLYTGALHATSEYSKEVVRASSRKSI